MENNSTYKPYLPPSNSPCLCGSGLRFKECCKDRLPGFDNGKRWREAADAGRWLLAAKHARADVCQYSIWHLRHTVTGVSARFPHKVDPVQTDVDALSDFLEILMGCYVRYGWLKKLPAVLDRLKPNIDDDRWRRKIAYQRAICALWADDRDQAIRELEPLQPITPAETDIDLLQVQVDLHRDKLGMSGRLAFFGRIFALTWSRADKLHYGGAHAAELLVADDMIGARAKFDEVIALGREMEAVEPLSAMAQMWMCKALEGRAALDKDKTLYAEIVTRLTKLLGDGVLSDVGRAETFRAIGDAHRYAGNVVDALAAYRKAFEAKPNQLFHVFEADCELQIGQTDEAFRLIRSVSVDLFDMSERADHAFTFFHIAAARRDRETLLEARDLLKSTETPDPYFNRVRLHYIIAAGETIEALDAQREPPPIGPALSVLKLFSRYVQVKPTMFGIGINGNAVIDDIVARAEEKAKVGRSPH